LRPVLGGQPGDGDGPPLRLHRTVGRRVGFECRGAHPSAHVGSILRGVDDRARSLHVIGHRPDSTGSLGSDGTSAWRRRSAKDARKQFDWRDSAGYLGRGGRSRGGSDGQVGLGEIQPNLKETGDDTDLPRVAHRSGTTEYQRTLSASDHRLTLSEVSQYEVEDAAVAEVLRFGGRVDA
jgi:hypothetical protein